MSISHEEKLAIRDALEARGATLPCPRCGGESFDVLDGYFYNTFQFGTEEMTLKGKGVLAAVIGCCRCGYLMQHATNLLGLTRTKCQIDAEAGGPTDLQRG